MLFQSFMLLAAVSALPSTHHSHSKRDSNTCKFPTDLGLVAVNKDGTGGGWAISKDQYCKAGSYCPYACPSGQLSSQWKQGTTYKYPESMDGGLYCNSDGTLSKPRSGKGYCYDGEGTLKAQNKMSKNVAICQTVLPGNEEMLIPTDVNGGSSETLAVPDPSYWDSTGAHYYVNPPGVSVDDGCTWGTISKPQGNWSPYIIGTYMNSDGQTFVNIAWNPKYLDDFSSTKPSFGIRIECEDSDKCVNSGCEINPNDSVGKVRGSSNTYCITTATDRSTAKVVLFSGDDSSSSSTSKVINLKSINSTVASNTTVSSGNSSSASSASSSASASTNGASDLQMNWMLLLGLLVFVF